MRRKLIAAGIVLMIALVAAGWFARKPLLARYYVRQLSAAVDHDIDYDGLVSVSEAALPRILDLMRSDDVNMDHLQEALTKIVQSMPPDDPRLTTTGEMLANSYAEFGFRSRYVTLRLAEEFAARADKESAGRIVRAALKDADATLRAAAAELAVKLDARDGSAVLPLLHDPDIAVRRRVLEAVGPSPDLATDEDLLPMLHDSDEGLRARCEEFLRGRGLGNRELDLGRLLTDPSPLKRLQIIDRLPADADLDADTWLQRLSQDPSPAVRIGAARAAMDPTSPLGVNLTERVREMAQRDPDGTVRQIAEFLIRSRGAP
jgi:hypothetical protein